jgi:hypothetical protein
MGNQPRRSDSRWHKLFLFTSRREGRGISHSGGLQRLIGLVVSLIGLVVSLDGQHPGLQLLDIGCIVCFIGDIRRRISRKFVGCWADLCVQHDHN